MNLSRRTLSAITIFTTLWMAFLSSAWAEQGDRLAAFVEQGMEQWQVPGMAVTVVDSNGVQFSRGFGKTSISNGQAVDEHTLFANASTTKAMVSAGILMLADQGRLALDDAVTRLSI